MGKAMMGTGEAEGENRATRAAEAAISNPLLEDTSMAGARGLLINITGGDDMTLFEVDQAANRVRQEVADDANIINLTLERINDFDGGLLCEAEHSAQKFFIAVHDGTAEIPGVNGTASPIMLRFREVAGAKTGRLFPTGLRSDVIDGVEVSLVDCAMPMMILRAADLGVSAEAAPAEIDGNKALLARIEAIRMEAGRRMGFGDVTDSVVPKVGLVGPTEGADFAVRYLTPHAVHKALAVTGAICLAAAAKCPGTTVHSVSKPVGDIAYIRHPGGVIEVPIAMTGAEDVAWAGMLRTARRIMEGTLLVPGRVWAGGKPAALAAE
jgi:2-methylaconitate cis-trans-isomerase PrpF